MKTEPMPHQVEGLKRLAKNQYYALGADMGTGKTWMLMADAEARWKKRQIDALLVLAPKGVHINWVKREVPQHLEVPHSTTFWRSGAGKRHMARLEAQLNQYDGQPRHLVIHAMNIDAINTKNGLAWAKRFMASFPAGKVMMVVDESHMIKNITAKRTLNALELGLKAGVRRIASGTIFAGSPIDLFAQYEFLATGLLGTRSYRAFVSTYAELLDSRSPLVQEIMQRTGARGAPQIIAKDKDGRPKYKNLDKLTALIEPYTFRVTKDECLGLPPKIYEQVYFELEPEQRAAYDHVLEQRNWLREDGEVDTFTALSVITKLRQITSGFILVDGEPTVLAYAAPRMAALREAMDGIAGQYIIWANYEEEIRMIDKMLTEEGVTHHSYYGATNEKARETAIDDFQSGKVQVFLGNPQAAGVGLTLTAATTAIYYSNDFSLVKRRQSEDRCHRKGTVHKVVYIDLMAEDTVDERIATALQDKQATSDQIMGKLAWILG